MRVVFAITVLGGISLLGLAVWPGGIEIVLFDIPYLFVSLPLIGAWSLLLVALGTSEIASRRWPTAPQGAWGLASLAILLVTVALVGLRIPQRLAIVVFHDQLQQLVDDATVEPIRGNQVMRRVGPYRVDRYMADPRGGVYFRTATGKDGIGPDEMSYGFAYMPNGDGSPFGNARYGTSRLVGDWYAFQASDDW